MIDPNNMVILVYPYPWYNARLNHKDVFLFPMAISDALKCQMSMFMGKFVSGSEREGQNKSVLRVALLINVILLCFRLLALKIFSRQICPRFIYFHIGWPTALLAFFCCILWGKSAKIVVKSDFNAENNVSINNLSLIDAASVVLINRVDCIVVGETSKSVDVLKNIFHGGKASVMLCRNGFDVVSLPLNYEPDREIDVLIVSRFRVLEKGRNAYALVVPLLTKAGFKVMLVGDGVHEFLSELGLKESLYLKATEKLVNLDVLKAMKRSKIFLNLSVSESFIIALVEAYAMGCQVICTPVGIGPDLAMETKNVSLVSSDPSEVLSAVTVSCKNQQPRSPVIIGTWEEVVRSSGIIRRL